MHKGFIVVALLLIAFTALQYAQEFRATVTGRVTCRG